MAVVVVVVVVVVGLQCWLGVSEKLGRAKTINAMLSKKIVVLS